jgi:hypothetical protein
MRTRLRCIQRGRGIAGFLPRHADEDGLELVQRRLTLPPAGGERFGHASADPGRLAEIIQNGAEAADTQRS